MGLAVGGTAVAVGIAPVAVAGAVVGLAAYGLNKLRKSGIKPKNRRGTEDWLD